MARRSSFREFRTSPEIIRLAMMPNGVVAELTCET
jgi:hypothetical protein